MPDKGDMPMEGLREALINMGLGERDIRNLARQATHAVSGRVTKRAKRNAPRRTGRLIKATKPKRRRAWPDLFRSDTYVYRGESRDDSKGAYYWHMVERGTKHQAAQPFIMPALEATAPEAIKTFRDEVLARAIKLMERRAK